MRTAPHFLTGTASLARGLAHRGGSTLMILLVSVAAAAAAAAGPIYYAAAKTSIMRDLVVGQPLVADGFEANVTGPLDGIQNSLTFGVAAELNSVLGRADARRLFGRPVVSLEGTAGYPPLNAQFVIAWRDGMCGQLRIQGACPRRADQVLVPQFMARVAGWHVGQRLANTGWPALTITGIYQPPPIDSRYWAARAATYFPIEDPIGGSRGPGFDAFFTARPTLADAPAAKQGTAVVDQFLNTANLAQADVPKLGTGMGAVSTSETLGAQSIIVSTDLPDTMARIEANWRTVAVPVALITIEVLTLSWLLLFLAVTDAVAARGPEIALAKLRGHGRLRTLLFGLSEPIMLLAVALPAGVGAGFGAAYTLDSLQLRPGTPTSMTLLAWGAAAVATAGGFSAVALAARRTLRRGVVEQFRRSGRQATDRGWVMDAILLTGSAAGLLDLVLSGRIGSASRNVLGLLVPGLLGLAVAVVASRLLPIGCRAVYGWTARHGGIAAFLAARHIARRPGGTRTTIVLATAFALTSFAATTWAVTRDNYQLVASARVGAPTVLTVAAPPGKDLGAIVDRADPGGRLAAAVDEYVSLSGSGAGDVTLGVDPQRFARVAAWPRWFSAAPVTELAARLDPPAPPSVVLAGDAMRVTVDVGALSVPGEQLSANVTTGASPVQLGALPAHGTVTLTGELVGCPCVLQSLALSRSVREIEKGESIPVTGKLTITSLSEHLAGHWAQVAPAVLASAGAWRPGLADNPPDVVSISQGGVRWSFHGVAAMRDLSLDSVNRPAALPALVPRSLLQGRTGILTGTGFDGSALPLRPIGVAAVPGAPGNGVVVDRRYAELASGEDFTYVTQQVWLAAGAQPLIEPRLKAAGVRITAVASAAAAAAALSRQGPGLVSLLFLADAGAAALLAVGAAILGLYLSARRRRYEYAALEATGISRRTLRRALLIEMAVVLGYGTVIGIAAGLAAAAAVLRSIPEFVSYPSAPPLSYTPPPLPLTVLLGAAVAVLAAASAAASVALVAGVRLEQLREAPS